MYVCMYCFAGDKSDICLLLKNTKISCSPNHPEIIYLEIFSFNIFSNNFSVCVYISIISFKTF